RTSERTAWIEEYSQPCTPASRQSVGPSAAPRTSTIGNSTPARAGLSNLWSRRSIMLDLVRDADIASRPSSQTERSTMKRVVTGWDESGKPTILFEGEPPTVMDFGPI